MELLGAPPKETRLELLRAPAKGMALELELLVNWTSTLCTPRQLKLPPQRRYHFEPSTPVAAFAPPTQPNVPRDRMVSLQLPTGGNSNGPLIAITHRAPGTGHPAPTPHSSYLQNWYT